VGPRRWARRRGWRADVIRVGEGRSAAAPGASGADTLDETAQLRQLSPPRRRLQAVVARPTIGAGGSRISEPSCALAPGRSGAGVTFSIF
jgi:hypothetical protein